MKVEIFNHHLYLLSTQGVTIYLFILGWPRELQIKKKLFDKLFNGRLNVHLISTMSEQTNILASYIDNV